MRGQSRPQGITTLLDLPLTTRRCSSLSHKTSRLVLQATPSSSIRTGNIWSDRRHRTSWLSNRWRTPAKFRLIWRNGLTTILNRHRQRSSDIAPKATQATKVKLRSTRKSTLSGQMFVRPQFRRNSMTAPVDQLSARPRHSAMREWSFRSKLSRRIAISTWQSAQWQGRLIVNISRTRISLMDITGKNFSLTYSLLKARCGNMRNTTF